MEGGVEANALFLLTVGGILLSGLFISTLGKYTFLPRVTLLLIFGALLGHSGFDIIPEVVIAQYDFIAEIALLMVGFLIGGKLTSSLLRNSLNTLLWVSILAALLTVLVVSLGLITIGVELELAILLACIASATAPAAILDVVMSNGEARGSGKKHKHKKNIKKEISNKQKSFQELLVGIVALDDAWALILFSLGVAIVLSMNGHGVDSTAFMAINDIGGALILGLVLGFPAALLTGRIRKGKPMLTEALALVFLCGGFASYFHVSFLIAAMVLGSVIANFAKHHEYPFHAIEGIEELFMVVFFVLAGASLQIDSVLTLGTLGIAYIALRILGKILGSYLGCKLSGQSKSVSYWMGPALLPQAGVAIGMALVASNLYPQYETELLSIVIASTIFFELIGPVFTQVAIHNQR